jgi:2-keto-4-pentenoate hydratase
MTEDMDNSGLIARLLHDRQTQAPFIPVRVNGKPITIAQAYRMQNAVVTALGNGNPNEVSGYKVGLTESDVQERLGVAEPIIGCLLDRLIHPSGMSLSASAFGRLAIECEIALLIDKPADIETSLLTWSDIRSVHAAFELIDDHGASLDQADGPSIIADNAWHAGVILAQGLPVTRDWDACPPSGALSQNEQTVATVGPDPILGGPLSAANWVNAFLARSGKRLQSGDIVLTGALIGPLRFSESSSLRFEVEGLPPVTLDLSL